MSSLENVDSIVLGLVKEYLTKKTFFSINDIIEYVNNRLKLNPNINRYKVELVIKSLIKKRIIIPGTKLMKNNIIEHPKRNEIYNFIKKYPSNINEIMRALNTGSNQTLWHLSCLEKFRFVRSKKIGNRKIFFKFDSNPKHDEFYYYLKLKIVQKIITLIRKEKDPIKITTIATTLKKNHNTIKKYLDILENLKLLKTEKKNKRIVYKLDKDFYSKIKKSIPGIL